MRRTILMRAAVLVAAAAVTVLGVAAPASAHVTVSAASAVQGGYTKVAFRVPNEKDQANTTKLEVTMPEGQPIASVSVRPLPGWTTNAEKTKLPTPIKTDDGDVTEAVTKITWTADPAAVIKPGQFQELEVALGPLPKVDQLEFKALQYYSDGDIVRWIEEPPAAGGAEPEHPAPVLKLAKAAAGDATGATAATANSGTSTSGSKTSGSNGVAVGLGVAGLLAGLAGLVVGVLAYRKASARTS